MARCARPPARTAILDAWKERRGGRAAPVILVALHSDTATLCGPTGATPPVHGKVNIGQVERLCREALSQPDRHAALKFLAHALPSLETVLPGLNNEGLVALHELQHGSPGRPDWAEAARKAARVLGKRDSELLAALGFQIERLDNLTHLLRSGDRCTALAVLLRESESPEAGTARFNSLSPVNYALSKADAEKLSWVVLVQGNRLRLYSTAVDAGLGRRGRTETFIECQPSLLADEHLAYLWLLYSAEALAPDGSVGQILGDSQRFAGDLAERLRERIYDQVVPELARGIAAARDLQDPRREAVDRTYEMALTVLFRLLFIAYAEDRDLLPYRFNEAYRRRSLKQKAQELARCVADGTPIAEGSSHWQEVTLLWEAVATGNREWGAPAYDGGLFASDPADFPPGRAAHRGPYLHRLPGVLPALHPGATPACLGAGPDPAQRAREVRCGADDRLACADHRWSRAAADPLHRAGTRAQAAARQAEAQATGPTAPQNHRCQRLPVVLPVVKTFGGATSGYQLVNNSAQAQSAKSG